MNENLIVKNNPLKECPFCGKDPEMILTGNDFTKERQVEIICRKCCVTMRNKGLRSSMDWLAEISAKMWNNRV